MKLGQTILDIRKERKMTQEEIESLLLPIRSNTTDSIKLGERKELSGFRNSDFYER